MDDPIRETVKRLRGMLAPGGYLVSALMVGGTCEELQTARKDLFANKAGPVCLPRAEEILEAIAAAGLRTESAARRSSGSAMILPADFWGASTGRG